MPIDKELRLHRWPTPIGTALVVMDARERVCALDWEEYEARLQRLLRLYQGRDERQAWPTGQTLPATVADPLGAYFAGNYKALQQIAINPGGTEFQRQVWGALQRIPPGTTITYGELAAQVGRPSAVRAVGHANGSNPIGIVIPCHRVIGANASLTGYAGGLPRKRWLLAHESSAGTQKSWSATRQLQLV